MILDKRQVHDAHDSDGADAVVAHADGQEGRGVRGTGEGQQEWSLLHKLLNAFKSGTDQIKTFLAITDAFTNLLLWHEFPLEVTEKKVCLHRERSQYLGGRFTVQLISCMISLDSTKQDNLILFICTKVIESKPVKTGDELYSDTSPIGECSLVL